MWKCELAGYEWMNLPPVSYGHYLLMGLMFGILGILGDAFESLIKRLGNVKDSGTFFTGHGGVLDRFDTFYFIMPCYYYYLYYAVKPLFQTWWWFNPSALLASFLFFIVWQFDKLLGKETFAGNEFPNIWQKSNTNTVWGIESIFRFFPIVQLVQPSEWGARLAKQMENITYGPVHCT